MNFTYKPNNIFFFSLVVLKKPGNSLDFMEYSLYVIRVSYTLLYYCVIMESFNCVRIEIMIVIATGTTPDTNKEGR